MDDEDNAASRVPERRDPSSPADMGSLTTIGVEFADPQLEASVRAGLDAVESTLRTAVRSDDQFIAEAARYLVDAGGKRFRPLMTVLAAHFGDASAPHIVPAAVVVELTHLATLYHDDVMDEASVRRGAESANARWDNTVAILTGDFLFARASDLLAEAQPPYACRRGRSSGWSPGRSARPSDPPRAKTRSRTVSGCLPRRPVH